MLILVTAPCPQILTIICLLLYLFLVAGCVVCRPLSYFHRRHRCCEIVGKSQHATDYYMESQVLQAAVQVHLQEIGGAQKQVAIHVEHQLKSIGHFEFWKEARSAGDANLWQKCVIGLVVTCLRDRTLRRYG